ncbi:MAG: periplasmic heavy metal sensor [Kiritimatiellae bacterium]|nr:periplasmic heavy metal sensor [Kiritimatiellia bacterium]MDW8459369.1 periplasmic heavy metal sensor [Verrucomicrobiota bacterium]
MRKNTLTWSALLVGAVTGLATAEPMDRPWRPDPEERGPRWERILEDDEALRAAGLTDAQVAAIRERAAESEKTLIRLRSEVQLAEAEIRRLMRTERPDRDAIMKAVEAAGAARTALRKAMVEEQLAVREILGPEGFRKLRKQFAKPGREGEHRPHPGPRAERKRDDIGD